MSLSNEAREVVYEFLSEFVCSNEDLGFCNSCPELRYCEDIGCYDCPAGLAVDSCEYYPQRELDELADEVIAKLEEARP